MTKEEQSRRLEALAERYPELFREIGRPYVLPGWLTVFEDLCGVIDAALAPAEKGEVYFLQVKEKWGGLRAYLNVAPMRVDFVGGDQVVSAEMQEPPASNLYERIAPLGYAAERRSYEVCCFCGAPGTLRRKAWVLTLCERHAPFDTHDLAVAFELLTEPDGEVKALGTAEAIAILRPHRAHFFGNFGVSHLGLLPPAGKRTPARLRVVVERPAEESLRHQDVAEEVVRLTGAISEAISLEALRFEPGHPSPGDVEWAF